MDIKYRGHKELTRKAMPRWLKIYEDYQSGMRVVDVAKKNGVSKATVYKALNRLKTL